MWSECWLTNKPCLFFYTSNCISLSLPPHHSVVANNRAEFFLVGKPLEGEWIVPSPRLLFFDNNLIFIFP